MTIKSSGLECKRVKRLDRFAGGVEIKIRSTGREGGTELLSLGMGRNEGLLTEKAHEV